MVRRDVYVVHVCQIYCTTCYGGDIFGCSAEGYININHWTKAGMNSQYEIPSFIKKGFEGFESSHVFLIFFINVDLALALAVSTWS